MKKIIIIVACPFVVTYLLFAFIMWDPNPHNWSTVARIIYLFFAILGSIGRSG